MDISKTVHFREKVPQDANRHFDDLQ